MTIFAALALGVIIGWFLRGNIERRHYSGVEGIVSAGMSQLAVADRQTRELKAGVAALAQEAGAFADAPMARGGEKA